MTREEAVTLLRRYRRDVYRYNKKTLTFPKRDSVLRVCVYGRFLIADMIRSIMESTEDPIRVAAGYYARLDEILGNSDDDHFETHRFAAMMELEAGNVLRYLRNAEKEKNEDAEN